MDIGKIVESLIGSGPIAGVLLWFMWQHMNLIKQLIASQTEFKDLLKTNTAALTRVHNALDKRGVPHEL
jgi:hypothetical protein